MPSGTKGHIICYEIVMYIAPQLNTKCNVLCTWINRFDVYVSAVFISSFRFVPDLDDIVSFEDLMKEEGADCMPEETVAAARCVRRGWEGEREEESE